MASLSYSILFLLSFSFSFASSFDGFASKAGTFDETNFALFGTALPNGTTVTTSSSGPGGVLRRNPITFGRNPTFSTDFTFSVSAGGNGIAFFIAPGNVPLAGRPFGFSPGVFAVEFDTRMDVEAHDVNANHVGIDVGSPVSVASFDVSALNFSLNSGEKFRSWIDFNGDLKFLEVRLDKFDASRPTDPFVSYPIDLSALIWQDSMFVGISSYFSESYVYSWRFEVKRSAPYRMHSEPLDPRTFIKPPEKPMLRMRTETSYLPVVLMALAFGAACGAAIAFLVMLPWSTSVVDRTAVTPVDYSPRPEEFEYEKIVIVRDKCMVGGNGNGNDNGKK